VRIGVEMVGTQSESRRRGIGRYCRNFAEALVSRGAGSGHEFVFYAVTGLPTDQVPVGPNAVLRGLRPDPHLRQAFTRLVSENRDGLDVLVVTNPLELNPGNDIPARPARGRGPALAAVVYDLIPLLFPDHYLRRWPGTLFARRYLWTLERLRTYDLLLAISGSTRADVVRRLNVPAGKVVAVGTGGDDRGTDFSPGAGADADPADVAAVRGLGLDGPFVFSVAAADWRKNLVGLIDAFALLPTGLRATHRLAVAAGMTAEDEPAVEFLRRAEARGVRDALVPTGPVDDPTLRALYRRCAAFAFPSLYEGFGLPVLEALRCGAAVVAGDHSSLPEVAEGAALLVNASEPAAMASGLAAVLNDEALARSLRAAGPERARSFTWDAVADRTLEALSAMKSGPPTRQGPRPSAASGRTPRPRIAFFSPTPPNPSGVANSAEGLIDALGDRYAVDLFHDARESPFARFRSGGVGCFEHRLFARVDRVRPYHSVVYQMGNSPAHLFVYEEMIRRRPGVVVLHDPSLVLFHYERSVRLGGGREAFRRVLEATHPDRAGEWGPLLEGFSDAPEAMTRALADAKLDMSRVVVALAAAVVVHSRGALERLGPSAAAKAFVVPLGAGPLARPAGREAARARLGLPPGALVVGSFGIVRPSKLNAEAVEAFAAVARSVPGSVFLVVGEEADGGLARRRAEALGLGDRVRFLGRPGDDEFLDLVAATDLGVALRRPPTNGESSAALLDLLRSGVPAVVTDTGSFSEYPDGVVRKVPWDGDKAGVEALTAALLGLAADPAARDALGRAGLDQVRAHHAWPEVAARYAEVIEWSTRLRAGVGVEAGSGPGLYRGPHFARRGVGRGRPYPSPDDRERGER
jgi:glycosyltransferase involved in cell wall biosynthesis